MWVKGVLLYDTWNNKLIKDISEGFDPKYVETYDKYTDDDDYENVLEYYEESYTTPSGDEIIVFGKYGTDR